MAGVCCFGYATLSSYLQGTSAVSRAAAAARSSAYAIVQSAERSQALFGPKRTLLTELAELARECAEPDWDGEGALALKPGAIETVEQFIRALPPALPLPELAPDPDGAISMDWIAARTRRLTVSADESNRLAYAWMDGADSGHAVERFDGETIPHRIAQEIRTLFPHDSSLRAA